MMMKFLKRLLCAHKFVFIRNIYGDEIHWWGGHRGAKQEKMRKEFEDYLLSVGAVTGFDIWQAACANKQKEIEQYKLIGYTQPGSLPIDPRGADSIYIVEEAGFDGCTVPVFIKGE